MDKMLNGAQDSVTGFLDLTFRVNGTDAYVKVNNYATVKDKISAINFLYTESTDADSHKWVYKTVDITLNANGEEEINVKERLPNARAFTYEFVMTEAQYRWTTEVVIWEV